MPDHQGPVPVGEHLPQGADLPDRLEGTRLHHGQRLVEPKRLPLLQGRDLDIRRAGQTHLAPGGEDVDGVVVVGAEHHPVAAGRLAQPIDLLTQRQQLLACFLEGVHQLGVSGRQRVDPGLELLYLAR